MGRRKKDGNEAEMDAKKAREAVHGISDFERVTGSVQPKTTTRGKCFLYMVFCIYHEGCVRPEVVWRSTGLEEQGNKRRAEGMLSVALNELEHVRAGEKKDPIDERNPFLNDCLEEYLKAVEPAVEKNTFEGYCHRAKSIRTYFKGIRVREIKIADVDRFCQYLLKEGKMNQKTGEREPMKPRTVSAIKTILVSVLNRAVREGFLENNPACNVKVTNKSKGELARKFHFMKTEELERLFRFMESRNDPMTDIIKLIAFYGLRRSEAVAIRVSPDSLDMENRVLRISRTVVRLDKGTEDRKRTKTHSSNREFPLTEDTYAFFKEVIEKKESNKAYFGNTYIESPYLFTWEDGKPFEPDLLTSHFVRVMRDFGRPDFTIHNLRHSCASNLFRLGIGEWELAEWLGHADPATTRQWYVVLYGMANEKTAQQVKNSLKLNL